MAGDVAEYFNFHDLVCQLVDMGAGRFEGIAWCILFSFVLVSMIVFLCLRLRPIVRSFVRSCTGKPISCSSFLISARNAISTHALISR